MAVNAVIDIELSQCHISIRVIAREMELVVEQAPATDLASIGLEKFRAMIINQQAIEHDEDACRSDCQPSFLLMNGENMKGIDYFLHY